MLIFQLANTYKMHDHKSTAYSASTNRAPEEESMAGVKDGI